MFPVVPTSHRRIRTGPARVHIAKGAIAGQHIWPAFSDQARRNVWSARACQKPCPIAHWPTKCAGLDELLVKPLDRERLREVLNAASGRASNPLAA
jgi:hypothetical protein